MPEQPAIDWSRLGPALLERVTMLEARIEQLEERAHHHGPLRRRLHPPPPAQAADQSSQAQGPTSATRHR